jgi:hypothetical protein
MTRFIETEQSINNCDEDISNIVSHCQNNSDCENEQFSLNTWSGKPNGKCVKSSLFDFIKVCEITGWCPTEKDRFRLVIIIIIIILFK